MLERQVSHPAGSLPRCRTCGAEPHHITTRGRSRWEPFDPQHPPGERHYLECRCEVRTARHACLMAAQAEWLAHFARQSAVVCPLRKMSA